MSPKNKDENTWSFELKTARVDKEKKSIPTKKVVSSVKKRAKVKHKPLAIDQNEYAVRRSRRALAQDLEQEDRIYDEVTEYPRAYERFLAGAIDFLFIIIVVAITDFFAPLIGELAFREFAEQVYQKGYSTEFIRNYSWIAVAAIAIFLTYTMPTILFRRSLGKKVLNLYIARNSFSTSSASYLQIIARELIFKPLSFVSIIGVLLIYASKDQRGFHDLMSGTTVLKV